MNVHCHAQAGIAAFHSLRHSLDSRLIAEAERHIDCTGHFDRSLEEVQITEPRWQELVHSRVAGSVQLRTMEAYGGDTAAFLLATAERVHTASQADDAELAAMHLLFASHAMADHCGTPAHTCDLAILDVLFARPDSFRYRNLHQLLETIPAKADLANSSQVPWIGDPADAVVAAMQAMERERITTSRLLIPLLKALYDDNKSLATELTSQGVSAAARAFRLYAAHVLARTHYWHGPTIKAPDSFDLRLLIETESILDACCDRRPMIDGTVVYGEPERWRDRLIIEGKEQPGLCFIPLSPRATHHLDHPAIPFPHGRCIGLVGWRLNPARRYRLRTTAGHNESVSQGGRLRVAAFSKAGGYQVTEGLAPGKPATIDIIVQGERVWLFAEDLDESYPPLKYAAFATPMLTEVH